MGLAAVGVTVIGIMAAQSGGDPTDNANGYGYPPISLPREDTTAPTWAGEIASEFPLAAGLPATNGDGSPVEVTVSSGVDDIDRCGLNAWSTRDTVDVAGVTFNDGSGERRARTLALYADDGAAKVALSALRLAVVGCPVTTVGSTDHVYDMVSKAPRRVIFTHRYSSGGELSDDLEVLVVVREGRALYLATSYSRGDGSAPDIKAQVRAAEHDSAKVVAALADL
ncbi:hypothetical protein [Nocardioides sp. GXZ039]|uniref:hypothetical protein n=1 Tax=Nocardioides sp. GXZ039 TaxID=3136018 RepID=UPI0030F42D1A